MQNDNNPNLFSQSPGQAVSVPVEVLPPARSVFVSKTAMAQYVLGTAGALAAFGPDAVPWLSSHAGAVMMIAAGVNIAIRHFTHGKVGLFPGS